MLEVDDKMLDAFTLQQYQSRDVELPKHIDLGNKVIEDCRRGCHEIRKESYK